jgi:nitroreductase/NAD-dependent dihydropyrimidine dehydrogenase PreA subunit
MGMGLFSVNKDLCNGDGICAAECPIKIIQMKENLPQPVHNAEAMCINCGHCVAVCPKAALSLKTLSPEQCLPVNKEWMLSPEQAEHFLRSRRSIRNYKNKAVDKTILEQLIHVASFAPSGHNAQPVRWQVIYEREEVKRLSGMVIDWMGYMLKEHTGIAKKMHFDLVTAGWTFGMDTVSRGAPHLILANGDKNDLSTPSACTIAMTYLELAAQPLGLGSCWNGFFNAAAISWPPLQKALGLEQNQGNFGAMMVGYPVYKYHRMPLRNAPQIKWS